ncbi:MAG: 2,3-dimethylmalate dehydratase large subunit [Lentisphaerae bacterium ADurb.BinA184]|nr:MAG: 2,3-dimethylmalate dehydratase large subunit [Lentisphaerae bacterium ADurb.BinA184]
MYEATVIGSILRDHLVAGALHPGAEVKIRIDQTLCQDATGTMAFLELEALGVDRVRTELSVQYIDHNTSQFGPENHNDHLYLESVSAAKGVWLSRAGNGICHQVHLERFGAPGRTLLGSDSHTPTNGGLGMVAIGAGGLDVAIAMAGGPFKLACPRIIGVRLTGCLRPWVAAKDVILHLLSILTTKGNAGCAIEYFGPGVATLSVPERATIANMGAELGVTTSVFPSDEVTRDFLRAQRRARAWRPLAAGPNASYERVIDIALDEVRALAACPSSPDHVRPVAELADTAVGQVIIGSCTNSSYKDLRLAAEVLSGRQVHPGVSLAVAPGSRQVLGMLAADGSLARLIAAGARILESACGPCIGQGLSPADDCVTVRTFNRNFAGRTGTRNDRCYLVSVETALAAALTGRLVDPASLGIPYPQVQRPRLFKVDDRMLVAPPADGRGVAIVRKATIGEPPTSPPFPADLNGEVLVVLGDKITTDHIMPAGALLKYRSNIPVYARSVFNGLNEPGRPTFAERAAAVRDAGRHGVIVAGESYGQGSSREHAAICPMFLGVRAVLACSFERIHTANLVNFGILPLRFCDPADRPRLEPGDHLELSGVAAQLDSPGPVKLTVRKAGGETLAILCRHDLSSEDRETVLAGGRLNLMRRQL